MTALPGSLSYLSIATATANQQNGNINIATLMDRTGAIIKPENISNGIRLAMEYHKMDIENGSSADLTDVPTPNAYPIG